MSSDTLTIRLDAAVKARLGTLAENTKRTRSFLAAEAIERYVERELAVISKVEKGLEDERTGRLVSHMDVAAEADAILAPTRP